MDEASAKIGYDLETAAPIQADHEGMVKFEGDKDQDFQNICAKVNFLKRKALQGTIVGVLSPLMKPSLNLPSEI